MNRPGSAATTLQADITRPGAVMGTPAYMSPEQARGQEVDKRTDIWAFGCCLFECLSGQRPFRGRTASDLMAEVLKSDPDWSQVPSETPHAVVTLLRRCLEKEPSRRLSSMGDIAITLDESTRGPAASSLSPSSPTTRHLASFPVVDRGVCEVAMDGGNGIIDPGRRRGVCFLEATRIDRSATRRVGHL